MQDEQLTKRSTMKSINNLIARYGIMGLSRLVLDLIYTRLFFPKARLIRRPVYLRGRRHIYLGERLTTGVGVRIDAFPSKSGTVITIGNDVQLNDYVHIAAIQLVTIGAQTLIASKVFIADHHHGEYRIADANSRPHIPPAERPLVARPVYIGERVWIGENVCVLPGVRIGDGAIIGAGAIVTSDIPDNCIAVGNPARVVRCFNAQLDCWVGTEKTLATTHSATLDVSAQ